MFIIYIVSDFYKIDNRMLYYVWGGSANFYKLSLRTISWIDMQIAISQPQYILHHETTRYFSSSRGARGQFCQYWNFMEIVPVLAILGQIVSFSSSSRGEEYIVAGVWLFASQINLNFSDLLNTSSLILLRHNTTFYFLSCKIKKQCI